MVAVIEPGEMEKRFGADWEIEAHVKDALKQYFQPEFLNRIDETIIFHRLTREDLARIVEIQADYLRRRLADRQITIEMTEAKMGR